MKDLVYRKKDILGLDIGTSNVKYVQLKENGKLMKLVGYGSFGVPQNIIIEGIISEPENLAEIIKKELANPPWGKIKAERVVCALPDSKLFTRILELPPLSEKDIEEAVNLEVEQSISIPKSDLYTDWQIVGNDKNKTFVLMAAAPKSIVDSYVQLFNFINLEPLALEISLTAIARSIIPKKNLNEPVLIVDVGGQNTNIAVFDNGIQIAGSYPVGADKIKESFLGILNLNEKEAENSLKIGVKNSKKSSEVIKGELKKVTTEIDRTIKYYKDRKPEVAIRKIILSGGLGGMDGLAEFLEEESGIKTIVGNPWSNISIYPLKPVPKREAPMYAAAIGLCLREVENE